MEGMFMLYIFSVLFEITYLDHWAALSSQKLCIHFLHEDWHQLLDLTNTSQRLCFFKGRKKGIAYVKKQNIKQKRKP